MPNSDGTQADDTIRMRLAKMPAIVEDDIPSRIAGIDVVWQEHLSEILVVETPAAALLNFSSRGIHDLPSCCWQSPVRTGLAIGLGHYLVGNFFYGLPANWKKSFTTISVARGITLFCLALLGPRAGHGPDRVDHAFGGGFRGAQATPVPASILRDARSALLRMRSGAYPCELIGFMESIY